MGVDKLVDSSQLDSDLTSVANAIRTRGGTSASLSFPSGFVNAINAIPSGGGSEPVVGGFMNHTSSSTSYVTAGNAGGGSSNIVYGNDDALFSYRLGTFTCAKAGTYKIQYYARGGYTSSGATRYVHFQISAAGSVVVSVTGNTVGNTGTSGEVTVTLAIGDEIYGRSKNNSGSNTHSFGYAIKKA